MAIPSKLKNVREAVNCLNNNIQLIEGLTTDEQVILNNALIAREKLAYATMYALNSKDLRNELEKALQSTQNVIVMLGGK